MSWLRSMIIPLSIVGSLGLSPVVLAEDLKPSNGEESELISQTEADLEIEKTEEDEKNWRTYIDLYGFLPHHNEGTIKLDGNSSTGKLSLSDILENVSSIATLRAGVEYGRWGLQTGIFHGAVDFNDSGSAYTTLSLIHI